MCTDIESGRLFRKPNGVVKRVPVGHQGCGGENTIDMRVDNSGIHIACETEIVRIDNEPAQNQKRFNLMDKNFFGLARKSLSNSCSSRVVPVALS